MVPAKLLLFGEHTVLQGGEALALPLRRFGARWREEPDEKSGQLFAAWAAFAKTRPPLVAAVDVAAWAKDATQLAVESNIPQNYGLGSSGALTALVFGRYQRQAQQDLALNELRQLLGGLESFFHGRSSGLDPLVCALDAAIHIAADGTARRVETSLPIWTAEGAWFLLDSRRPKLGEAAIRSFGASCRTSAFRKTYLEPAIALTQHLIASTLLPDETFEKPARGLANLQRLSQLQLEQLPALIPSDIAQLWSEWYKSDIAYLKLCGAGGGGYFLGYAPQQALLTADVVWLT